MNTTSVPQSQLPLYGRTVAGPATSRSYDSGDGAIRTAHGQPELGQPGPALEPPSTSSSSSSSLAEASEPGSSGAKRPRVQTLRIKYRSAHKANGFSATTNPWSSPDVAPLPPPSVPPAVVNLLDAGWANPEFTRRPWTKGRSKGEATVGMTLVAFMAALGAYWGWVARCLNVYPITEKLRSFVRKRVLRVETCGRKWRTPRCRKCGHKLGPKSRLVEACDSMTCPFCGRRKSQRRRFKLRAWVDAHEAKRVKGKLSRDFYLVTWTTPKRPWLSLRRLREDATLAYKACKKSWDKVLCHLPRRNGQKGYPGKCKDAGMVAFLEVGAGGMVHVTALYYGAFHRVEDLRVVFQAAVPGATNFEIKPVGRGPERKRFLSKAVNEACKYVCKGTVGGRGELEGGASRRHEYTHPLLCVLAELALCERNRVRMYGTAVGVFGDEDEDEDEDQGLPRECPCCGEVHMVRSKDADDPLAPGHLVNALWEWVEEARDYPWVPHGWGGGKRGPPAGGAP